MFNKKIIMLFVIFAIILGAVTFLYFKYWYEPEGIYVETDSPKLAQIRKDLDEYIADLKEKGLYDCCIRNDCKWCAIYMDHCPCGKLVSQEKAEKSCPECAAAWNRKQGKIPGVDPDAIEVTTFGIYGYEKNEHHYSEVLHHEKGHNARDELSGNLQGDIRVIQVKAFRYGFDPDPIVVRVNEKVKLEVISTDVKHGIYIEEVDVNFAIPTDKMSPVEFIPEKTGEFSIHCSIFCGPGHGRMKGTLKVIE